MYTITIIKSLGYRMTTHLHPLTDRDTHPKVRHLAEFGLEPLLKEWFFGPLKEPTWTFPVSVS